MPENSADGTFVGQLLAEDEDFNDSHTFRVSPDASGNAGDIFEVNSTTGVVSVLNGTALDYEAVNRYILEVVAADSGGLSITVNVTINVTDVNEAPSNIKLDNDEVRTVHALLFHVHYNLFCRFPKIASRGLLLESSRLKIRITRTQIDRIIRAFY